MPLILDGSLLKFQSSNDEEKSWHISRGFFSVAKRKTSFPTLYSIPRKRRERNRNAKARNSERWRRDFLAYTPTSLFMPVPTPHSCIRGSYIFHPAFPSLSQRLQISLLNNQANDLRVLFVCLRLHTFSFIFLSSFFYLRQPAFFFLFFISHSLLYCICITIPIAFFFFPGYLSTLIHTFVHCIVQLFFLR